MDCFGVRVRAITDLASQVCDPRMLNPQSGPFHIEGARPGDTLAVHFVSISPREGWGVSTTVRSSAPSPPPRPRRCCTAR